MLSGNQNNSPLILTSSSSSASLRRFFVYPGPTLLRWSYSKAKRGAKNRVPLCWRARRSQNQFTPPSPSRSRYGRARLGMG